ncbi:MAG: hypothetical protein KDK76_01955 [Chlamydiia bacterium]|nr:hypothetical protein [Chlamydiia bacterium]
MSNQKIHMQSIGVNSAIAGLYLYLQGKKVLHPALALTLSSVFQGMRAPIPLKQRDWTNDFLALASAATIGAGFSFSKMFFKPQLISGSFFWGSQLLVKEIFTCYELLPPTKPQLDPSFEVENDLEGAKQRAQALPHTNLEEIKKRIHTFGAIAWKIKEQTPPEQLHQVKINVSGHFNGAKEGIATLQQSKEEAIQELTHVFQNLGFGAECLNLRRD